MLFVFLLKIGICFNYPVHWLLLVGRRETHLPSAFLFKCLKGISISSFLDLPLHVNFNSLCLWTKQSFNVKLKRRKHSKNQFSFAFFSVVKMNNELKSWPSYSLDKFSFSFISGMLNALNPLLINAELVRLIERLRRNNLDWG